MKDKSEKALADSLHCTYKIGRTRVSGGDINFIEAGTGRPVVLIHGINTGWGEWYPNIKALAQGFKVYAIDLPGAGQSHQVDFNKIDYIRDFVEPVEEFLRVKSIGRPFLVGHSFGGWVAAKIASRKRFDIGGLVLVSPLGFSSYIPPIFYGSSIKFIARFLSRYVLKPTPKNISDIITTMLRNKENSPSDLFIDYYCDALAVNSSHPFLFTSSLCDFNAFSPRLSLTNDIPQINQRTLVILGEKDPILPPRKSLSGICSLSNSRVITYNDIGHVPSIEKPENFNRDVKEFLAELN